MTTPAEDPAAYESYYCAEKIEDLLKVIKDEMIVEEMGGEMFGNENNSIMKVKLRMKRCSTVKIYSTVTRYSTVKGYSTDFLFDFLFIFLPKVLDLSGIILDVPRVFVAPRLVKQPPPVLPAVESDIPSDPDQADL
jgi:hypothetical protein